MADVGGLETRAAIQDSREADDAEAIAEKLQGLEEAAHLGYFRGFTVAAGARLPGPAEVMLVQVKVLQARAGVGCGREDLSLSNVAAEAGECGT